MKRCFVTVTYDYQSKTFLTSRNIAFTLSEAIKSLHTSLAKKMRALTGFKVCTITDTYNDDLYFYILHSDKAIIYLKTINPKPVFCISIEPILLPEFKKYEKRGEPFA